MVKSMVDHGDNGLLELLEWKLVLAYFQMKTKKELEQIASRVETLGINDALLLNNLSLTKNIVIEDTLARYPREKVTKVSL